MADTNQGVVYTGPGRVEVQDLGHRVQPQAVAVPPMAARRAWPPKADRAERRDKL